MNRKFIIGLAAMVVSIGANAQTMRTLLVPSDGFKPELFNKVGPTSNLNNSAKTTGSGGMRTINTIDDLEFTTASSIRSNLAVASMFNDSTANLLYSDGTLGSVYLFGIYQLMNPSKATLNDKSLYPGMIDMGVNQNNNVKVDSIAVYGFYNRNDVSSTDSLILNVTNSSNNDIFRFYFNSVSSPWVNTNYNTDTLYFGDMGYNSANNEALTNSNIRIAVPMNSATFADSTADGWHRISFPVGMTMTNLDVIGTAVSFKYAKSWAAGDTLNTNLNSWLQRFYEESAGGYPKYVKNETVEVTGIATMSSKYTGGWDSLYSPSYAYTAPYRFEHADLDYVISCTDCEVLSIVERRVNLGNVYPNPATSVLNIPMEMIETGNVNVTIVNLLGQEVSRKDFGKMSGNQVLQLPTAQLESGMYMVNIMVDGAIAAATKVNIK